MCRKILKLWLDFQGDNSLGVLKLGRIQGQYTPQVQNYKEHILKVSYEQEQAHCTCQCIAVTSIKNTIAVFNSENALV